MAQQTAVEWFCNKLSDLDTRPRETLQILEWYEQAKQIEKEQLTDNYISGACEALSYHTPVKDAIKDGYFRGKAEAHYIKKYNK